MKIELSHKICVKSNPFFVFYYLYNQKPIFLFPRYHLKHFLSHQRSKRTGFNLNVFLFADIDVS